MQHVIQHIKFITNFVPSLTKMFFAKEKERLPFKY